MKEQLLADVESLVGALKAMPASPEMDKAIYQCDRLHLALRSSHNEGTRFAAFTVNKIVRDLGRRRAGTRRREHGPACVPGSTRLGVELQK